MKVSLNWLQKYIKTELSADRIAEGLTDLGLECNYQKKGLSFSNVVVADVVECIPHDNSDHLSVCIVDSGEKEKHTVVCGAPNVKAGISVPFAKLNATLDYGKFKIKRTKIRGVESEGMICSEKELGLGDSHEGIMILESSNTKGIDLSEIINIDEDIIYDIDLTPNRGDCLGHIGVARELALLDEKNKKIVNYENQTLDTKEIKESLKINIVNQDKCKRYTACILRGVEVKESPEWLRKRLESIGQKSINNIVDSANFILMDLGHPMHTFDLDKIKSNSINVRTAKKNERITTLDNCKQILRSDDLLICDGDNPIAIAGIIGGNNSGVDEKTKNILIESAYFNPQSIRKSSKSLGISTEASRRFERDTDINMLIPALNKLAKLIKDIAGGEISSDFFDIYKEQFEVTEISFNIHNCNKFLGSEIGLDTAKKIFNNLYIEFNIQDENLICKIPSFRNDLSREVDLYEEIARVFGYNNIDNSDRCSMIFSKFVKDERSIDNQIRILLSSTGFNEHYSNSLLNKDEIRIMDYEKSPVRLSNPLSKEMEFLRNSLLCGLVKAAKFNESRQEKLFKLFEVGAVHAENKFTNTKTVETFNVGMVWYESEFDNWSNSQPIDFYYAKGDLVRFLNQLGVINIQFKKNKSIKGFDILYDLFSLKNKLGVFGIPNRDVRSQFSIKGDLFFSELIIDAIAKSSNKENIKMSFSSYFPFINRDISILVSKDILFEDVYELITTVNKDVLKEVVMFDLYEGSKIDKNKKSMSFRIKFQSGDKTLVDEEVDSIMSKIVAELEHNFNAVQR